MIACGLTERESSDAGGRLYNAAVLISPAGEILLRHRKINELICAQTIYATGTSLGVVETELGIIGLNICADNFSSAAAIGHAQGMMGAQLIVSPSAWALDPHLDTPENADGLRWIEETWVQPYQTLARAHDLAVVGVSNVGGRIAEGELAGRTGIGASLAVGRTGQILARAPYGSQAVSVQTIALDVRDHRSG